VVAAASLAVGTVAPRLGTGAPSNNSAKKSDESALATSSSPTSLSSKAESNSTEFCQCTEGIPEEVARIEKALASPLNKAGLDYAETALREVADQLSADYNIPVQLDRSALEEASVSVDSKVTITLHNISLRSALRLMLKTLELTSIVQDEVLLITTKEAAEKQLKICVYDARKIISDANDKNVQSLVQIIKDCVASDSWADNGGGQAEILPLSGGLIVVTQTDTVQQQIRDLLATIQKMNRK
jgi:hypothetical protein